MILRAKVKAKENMPVGLPCCERMAKALEVFGEREIRVSTGKLKRTKCQFCKKQFMGMRIVGFRGWRIDPRLWEIEEGEHESIATHEGT